MLHICPALVVWINKGLTQSGAQRSLAEGLGLNPPQPQPRFVRNLGGRVACGSSK